MRATAVKADGTPVPRTESVEPVVIVDGQGFRNEALEPRSARRDLTQAERETLVQRHFERAQFRQIESFINLTRAVKLGAALREAGLG